MPNVQKGNLCRVKCPKHLEMLDRFVTARRRAVPGEVVDGGVRRSITWVACARQWVCDGRDIVLTDPDTGEHVECDAAPFCDACLYPIDAPQEGVEDSEIHGLPVAPPVPETV